MVTTMHACKFKRMKTIRDEEQEGGPGPVEEPTKPAGGRDAVKKPALRPGEAGQKHGKKPIRPPH
jgi:hypothetical protein